MEKLLSAERIEQKFARRLQTALLHTRGKGTGEIADFLGMQQAGAGSDLPSRSAFRAFFLMRLF